MLCYGFLVMGKNNEAYMIEQWKLYHMNHLKITAQVAVKDKKNLKVKTYRVIQSIKHVICEAGLV